ncbi:MAG: hypothetical protein H6Q17_1153 [Bacteroidetes bacterium]|jgi:hypothetical protein|nr:hypothetical protein [Bacteroidota bacterium]
MRILKHLTFVFVAIAICACSKGSDEPSKADFSTLGIKDITVNNITYSVKNDLLLELKNSKNIVISALQMTESTKYCVIEYGVIPTTKDTPLVSITSCYSDVSVVVSSNTTTDGITYIVLDVTRNGHDERVTYKFYFSKISTEIS